MSKFVSLCCAVALIFTVTACSSDKAPETSTTQQAAAPAAPSIGMATAPAAPVDGKVLETMDAAGYTYIRLETPGGEKWVAVNETTVEVGEEVAYMDGMVMQDFFSKSLDRTFPEIIFSNGLVGKGGAPQGMMAGAGGAAGESFSQALSTEGTNALAGAEGMITGSQKAVVPFSEVKVEKAPGENSYNIEEIFAKAAELDKSTVIVRGKVVKVSPRIMGRNWIHLQDGTGSPDQATHDLVVTTNTEPEADWDVITVEGVLAAKKDFGAGYSYEVIIEDAAISN